MILLPLEVFPGWPTPEPTSAVFMVLLTIVAPVACVALIALLAFARKLAGGDQTASTVVAVRDDD